VLHSLQIFYGFCVAVADVRAHSFVSGGSAIHACMVSAFNLFLNSVSERFLAIIAKIEDFEFLRIGSIRGQVPVPVPVQIRVEIEVGVGIFEGCSSILKCEFFNLEIHPNDNLFFILFFQMLIFAIDQPLTVSVGFLRELAAVISVTGPAGLARTVTELKFPKQQIFFVTVPVCLSDFIFFVKLLLRSIEDYFVTERVYFGSIWSDLSLMNWFLPTDFSMLHKHRHFEMMLTINELRLMITERIAGLIEWISKEQKEHNTGLTPFVVYSPNIEKCSVMYDVSRLSHSAGSKIGNLEPIGEIWKIFQLSTVPSTCFSLTEPFLGRWLKLKKYIWKAMWSDCFDPIFTASDLLSELKTMTNQHDERNSFMIHEGTLSFEDILCQFFVVFLASERVNQPVLNRFVTVGVITQQSSTLNCSKSMIETLFNLKLESNFLFQKEMMFNVFLLNSFETRKYSTEYDEFSIFFFERTRYDHSKEEHALFECCDYLVYFETNEDFRHQIRDCRFNWRENSIKTTMCGEDCAHILRTEVNEIRHLMRESGGSRSEDGRSFIPSESPDLIEIGSNVRMIAADEFKDFEQVRRVHFSSDSQVKQIYGFMKCTSLCRIEFPSSLEKIGDGGFSECTSLTDMIFSSDSHLKKIDGFFHCTSLCRIEFPSSLEIIGECGFRGCISLTEITFPTDNHLKLINGFMKGT
jgi:hypothetical protein